MQTAILTGQELKKMMVSGLAVLNERYKEIDALNVFPVPDGDTGTNMFLTFSSAIQEIGTIEQDSVSLIAEAASKGALMGARGNSGVILSQLLRGFAKGLKGLDEANARQVADALQEAITVALKAVMRPVEGTILTVARESAKEAIRASRSTNSVATVIERACIEAEETLEKTPELLPALKEAGVVDAGGMGWFVILTGFYQGLTDQVITEDEALRKIIKAPKPSSVTDFEFEPDDFTDEESVFKYPYCTEVLVQLNPAYNVDTLKEFISSIGNSMMVVESDGYVKVHVHTKNPGQVIEKCLEQGSLKDVKINNMIDQAKAKKSSEETKPTKTYSLPYAVIAVGTGEGLSSLMMELGCTKVIQGGQSMNPSTQEIINAVNEVDAENVIILPNNSNIIMTANQVASISDKNVLVIPSKSVIQGISALLSMTPGATIETVIKGMNHNIGHVKTGEITFSVRDTKFEGLDIKKDDILGLLDDKIQVVANSVESAVIELVDKMIDENSEICALYYGNNVSREEANSILNELEAKHSSVEFELHDGGQPLYYYMISVE